MILGDDAFRFALFWMGLVLGFGLGYLFAIWRCERRNRLLLPSKK